MHHFVDIIAGNDKTFQDMCPFLCFLQLELCAADCYFMAMLNKIFHAVFQCQQPRTAFHQRNAIYGERALKSRHFEQFIQDNIGIRFSFHVYYNTHALPARLVVRIGNTLELAFFHKVCDIFDKLLLIDTIRYFSNNNLIMVLSDLDFCLSTNYYSATAGFVGILYTLKTINICTCRKVRSLDILHQSVCINSWIIYICTATIDYFVEVMCRDIRCHTHGNTVASVYEQIRYFRRHNRRFLQGIIEIIGHINGVFFKIIHDMLAHL